LPKTACCCPGGLDTAGLERTFGQLLGPGVDFGDLYFQHARRESWSVEDGIVKDGAIPSSRAWACGRFPARRPASPTPTTSMPMRCWRRRSRRDLA
jgi:hypothetical protein